MTIINKYNDPLIFNWERDSEGNRISVPVRGEEHRIEDGKIVLEGLPDVEYGVEIANHHEVFSKDLLGGNTFFVDYKNTGIVYFDPKKGGIVRVSYYSRGMNYYPASRVWTKANKNGSVQETLDETLKNIKEIDEYLEDFKKDIIENREELELSIEEANTIIEKIKELKETAIKDILNEIKKVEDSVVDINIKIKNINNQIDELNNTVEGFEPLLKEIEDKANKTLDVVEQRIEELGDLEDLAKVTINQLEGAVKTANYTKDQVIKADFKAFNTMNELNQRIIYTEKIMEDLEEMTKSALQLIDKLNIKTNEIEDLLNDIDTTISDAVVKKQELKDIINEGEEIEQGIVNATNKGRETKDDLDISIKEGKDLINDLENIIELEGLDEKEVLEIIEKNVNDIKIYETSQEASEKAKVGQIYFIEGDTEPRIKTGDNVSTGLATERSVLTTLSTIENITQRLDEWTDHVNESINKTNDNFNKLFEGLKVNLE